MSATANDRSGTVLGVNGPVVRARAARTLGMSELVWIGGERLAGEIIGLLEDVATIQVYEDTTGVTPGDPVTGSGLPLHLELGPGLLGRIFDGIQRPLEALAASTGDFIRRGASAEPLDRHRQWTFTPTLAAGAQVQGGEILGTVPETASIEHRVLVPPDICCGTLTWVAEAGTYTLEDPVAFVECGGQTRELRLFHRWPVRQGRPFRKRWPPAMPLLTGQRGRRPPALNRSGMVYPWA